jgi:hypothetical protein
MAQLGSLKHSTHHNAKSWPDLQVAACVWFARCSNSPAAMATVVPSSATATGAKRAVLPCRIEAVRALSAWAFNTLGTMDVLDDFKFCSGRNFKARHLIAQLLGLVAQR